MSPDFHRFFKANTVKCIVTSKINMFWNSISRGMDSVCALSAVDDEMESQSGQTKDYLLPFAAFLQSTQPYRIKQRLPVLDKEL